MKYWEWIKFNFPGAIGAFCGFALVLAWVGYNPVAAIVLVLLVCIELTILVMNPNTTDTEKR